MESYLLSVSLVCGNLFIYYVIFSMLHGFLQLIAHQLQWDDFLEPWIQETVAALELCADTYEINLVPTLSGLPTYFIFAFLVNLRWSSFPRSGNNLQLLFDYLMKILNEENGVVDAEGRSRNSWAELKVYLVTNLLHAVSYISAFAVVHNVWLYGFHPTMVDKANQSSKSWSHDLQVSPYQGFFGEMLGVMGTFISSEVATDGIKLHFWLPMTAKISCSVVNASLMTMTSVMTGSYYNPLMALILMRDPMAVYQPQLAFVYMGGPFLGLFLSLYIVNNIHRYNLRRDVNNRRR